MNIHTILEVPSGDERSPACSMERRRNQEKSLEDTECIRNDWKTSEVEDEVRPTLVLVIRHLVLIKMEDLPSSFEFNGSDLIVAEQEKTANKENVPSEFYMQAQLC